MARILEYSVLDVFAERALEGNALAVFHDARGVSDAEMQALAKETNLSETVFVIPEEDESEGVRMRIFTTEEELPFAGHPTLGTASWVHAKTGAKVVTLRQKAGPIEVTFEVGKGKAQRRDTGEGIREKENEASDGVVGRMRQKDPEFGEVWDALEVAPVMGMKVEDFWVGVQPQTVSTGNPCCVVGLKDAETLAGLSIVQDVANPWLTKRGIRWFYCVAPLGDGSFRARMQWYDGEDPATGSAAGPCVAWLVKNGLAPAGTEVVIEQGVEIGRPSRILASASLDGDRVHAVDIGGRTIPVASGRYFLPG